MDKKIIVALDAMGGDYAPVETVKGAVDAVKELNVDIHGTISFLFYETTVFLLQCSLTGSIPSIFQNATH